jgi:hydroxymethylglutaryl-CoA reductase (NADPH)
MKIPAMLLRQLYSFGSLARDGDGIRFSIKNRLSDAALTGIRAVRLDGRDVPIRGLVLELAGGVSLRATELSSERPLPFALRQEAHLHIPDAPLCVGPHDIQVEVETSPFGTLDISARDDLAAGDGATPDARDPADAPPAHIPYDHDPDRNYGAELVAARQRFVEERTGVRPTHIAHYSFDPALTKGNIENFTGVAQVPIGIAGPLRVNGEHARGDFLIPLATTEGSLVASYSRGMKVLDLAGGVTCTVSGDRMQRAPVFIFDSAREARDFRDWARDHLEEIRRAAEATSHVAKLLEIETYLANKFAFLRFDFSTGDAAGQNMVSRATFAACNWIVEQVPTVRRFYLESNFATDKKASGVNMMRTRGKRVTAEATIPRAVLRANLRVEPESLTYHGGVANVGAFMAGVNNNGLHSVNGITAMFIATGQDVANVAEASSGVIYAEVTPAGDLYISITIPSLIVATHGGGTKLATQRECLRILGCDGPGTSRKLAEIIAGVVLAGEISLAAAISSLEWVSAHERYGRNR